MLADGAPPRPAVSPDLLRLLDLMQVRSEVVEQRLAETEGPARIEEIQPAALTALDRLVEARVHTEESALAAPLVEASPPAAAEETPSPAAEETPSSAAESEPEAAAEAIYEGPDAPVSEPDLDLLELNAAEAGQPVDTSAAVLAEEAEPVERSVEPDALLEPAQTVDTAPEEDQEVTLEAYEEAEDEAAPPHTDEGDQQPTAQEDIAAIGADLDRMETDLAQYEELTSPPPPPAPARSPVQEGRADDFQALLDGARGLEPDDDRVAPEPGEIEEEFPFLPAESDVRLQALNGPHPGAEFVGKSTLAGATGLFCLVERFNLPLGTRMKVSLMAPNFTEQIEIDDALVSRVRKAPGDAAEVQLEFEDRHDAFEQFVTRYFSDQPVGFSLFGRRRPKR